ncbi:hypothetical protein K1719_046684 [Acacia pycnantha]|nr:hypothetical protein K1719_046684 [Acacia pycnantha]
MGRYNPSLGDFTAELVVYNYPEIVYWWGQNEYSRIGPWNGLGFSGAPRTKKNWIDDLKFVSNKDKCLKGFKPKSPRNWEMMDWTQGCIHSESWSCMVKNRDHFLNFSGLKLADTTHSWVNTSMTLEECKIKCWENCSCTAFANSDISSGGGSGCAIWFGDLIDIKRISDPDQVIYIRLAAPETDSDRNKSMVIVMTIDKYYYFNGYGVVFCFLLYLQQQIEASSKWSQRKEKIFVSGNCADGSEEDIELPLYYFAVIVSATYLSKKKSATYNFSIDKKLGQGGLDPYTRVSCLMDKRLL